MRKICVEEDQEEEKEEEILVEGESEWVKRRKNLRRAARSTWKRR